ncbi:heme-binding protein [Coraliomargarita akajimensis]|uniref:SOUL heme-binding protein n=1 Tax=Coraliomargarita akajimensis (strain DSM 45221 / IAM 15411 / JCM 23193 / KCTC 12865 / 04OKA010-24) TaxID=583355 RepID=D5EM21_CORAD|nr:heme-binding protein [Coraliomargarita akajimensis]ADE55181.1 hypothetical protein Caka_2163 [Coraliomargarita akajimensis DSM 45221]
MKYWILLTLLSLPIQLMQAYEQAFPKTPANEIEIKTLPAATLIASTSEKGYFESNNGLFRPLFRYIQKNDIAMTTPVEAEIDPGIMYFYIGGDAAERELESTDEVRVQKLPERTVLSIGIRGGYTESRFNDARAKLQQWLTSQEKFTATGEARAIYWHGPFTLAPFKHAEVHIPVVVQPEPNTKS